MAEETHLRIKRNLSIAKIEFENWRKKNVFKRLSCAKKEEQANYRVGVSRMHIFHIILTKPNLKAEPITKSF